MSCTCNRIAIVGVPRSLGHIIKMQRACALPPAIHFLAANPGVLHHSLRNVHTHKHA